MSLRRIYRGLLSYITLYLIFRVVAMAELPDYPVGISLGYKWLSSAYYSGAGELRLVTRVETTQRWRDYYDMTIRNRRKHSPYNDPGTLALCAQTIYAITRPTREILGDSASIRAISGPHHFRGISSMSSLHEAGEHAGIVTKGHQVVDAFNGARLAYNLDCCAGYGYPEDCDVHDISSFVVVVDYGSTCFSIGFLSTHDMGNSVVGYKNMADFGEDSASSCPCKCESSRSEPLIQQIQDFIEEQLAKIKHESTDPVSEVRALILTGEASAPAMQDMRALLLKAMPQFANVFRDEIQPNDVGAAGAAYRARQTLTHEMFTEPEKPEWKIELGNVMHDDL